MKLLLASVIAVAFTASPVCAQQPADKAVEKAAKDAATEEATKAAKSTAAATISSEKVAPEVLDVVSKKKKYTTSDLVKAQLDAVSKPPG